jgi:protocatechuate 4,5-dioxygenase alpha chain
MKPHTSTPRIIATPDITDITGTIGTIGTRGAPGTRMEIPGTPIFDGAAAARGYALNKMCYTFNDKANRDAFLADEEAYCRRFQLTSEQRAAVAQRNVLAMLAAGGSIFFVGKLAGMFGLNVQDMGAQQTGMTVAAFKQKLLEAGK